MHIFLTGASTGIGNAIARELDNHFKGAAFFSLSSRKKELLDDLAKTLKSKSAVYAADLSEPAVAEMTLERAVKEHGPIDILINNAGMSVRKPAHLLDLDDWNTVIDTNLTSAFI